MQVLTHAGADLAVSQHIVRLLIMHAACAELRVGTPLHHMLFIYHPVHHVIFPIHLRSPAPALYFLQACVSIFALFSVSSMSSLVRWVHRSVLQRPMARDYVILLHLIFGVCCHLMSSSDLPSAISASQLPSPGHLPSFCSGLEHGWVHLASLGTTPQ